MIKTVKINQIFIPGLCLIVLLFFFSCNKNKNSENLFGEVETGDKLDRVTLTLFVPSADNQENPEVREVFDEIEKQTRKSLNINFNLVFRHRQQYQKSLEQAIENGDPCDLFYMPPYYPQYSQYGFGLIDYAAENELALDISSLFPANAPVYYKSLDPEALNYFTRNGKLLAIPNKLVLGYRPVVMVRQDLWEKYAIPPITDFESLEVYLDLIKKNEPDYFPLVMDSSFPWIYIFAAEYGYAVLDPNLFLVYRWDDPEMKIMAWEQVPEFSMMMDRLNEWYRKGYLKGHMLISGLGGKVEIPVFGGWITNQFTVVDVNATLAGKKSDFRYMEFPLFPEARIQRGVNSFEGFSVSSQSENPERALMFIEWVQASQKNYDLVRYGIKGTHYLLENDQYYFPPETGKGEVYFGWQGSGMLNSDYERFPRGSFTKDLDELRSEYMEKLVNPPHFGFQLNPGVMNVSNRLMTSYQILRDIVAGRYNEASIEEFIKDQKKYGLDDLILEAQNQLDQWCLHNEKK